MICAKSNGRALCCSGRLSIDEVEESYAGFSMPASVCFDDVCVGFMVLERINIGRIDSCRVTKEYAKANVTRTCNLVLSPWHVVCL